MKLFDFPNRPTGSLLELWQAVTSLVNELKPGAKAFVIEGVTVPASTPTAVRHGLRGAPSFVAFTPRSASVMSRPSPPDDTFIYVQAGAPSIVDILVVP